MPPPHLWPKPSQKSKKCSQKLIEYYIFSNLDPKVSYMYAYNFARQSWVKPAYSRGQGHRKGGGGVKKLLTPMGSGGGGVKQGKTGSIKLGKTQALAYFKESWVKPKDSTTGFCLPPPTWPFWLNPFPIILPPDILESTLDSLVVTCFSLVRIYPNPGQF